MENEDMKMARFIGGLNEDLREKLETHSNLTYEEAYKLASTYERQRKKKVNESAFKPSSSTTFHKANDNSSKESMQGMKPTSFGPFNSKVDTSKPKKDLTEIICFKCHGTGHYKNECPNARAFTSAEWSHIQGRSNKRAMIVMMDDGEEDLKYPPMNPNASEGTYKLNDLGEMVLCEATEDMEEGSTDDDGDSHEQIHPEGHRSCLIRRNFHAAPMIKKTDQRENIFQTKGKIKEELCDIIIDGGSETNCVDKGFVDRLGLTTSKHPMPYKLRWLDDESGQHVRKQCLVGFEIGSYKDQVLCDVLHMDACHVLLGRPWQHDRRSRHDGYTNIYTIKDEGKKKDLIPLPPSKAIPPPKVKQAHLAVIKQNEKFEAQGGVTMEKERAQRAAMIKKEVQQGHRGYEVGNYVFVDWKKGKFGPHAKKYKNKLIDQSMGPYEIVEQRGSNCYCVKLSEDPSVVAMFNIEDLTPYIDEELQNLRTNSFEEGGCEPNKVHYANKLEDHVTMAQHMKRRLRHF